MEMSATAGRVPATEITREGFMGLLQEHVPLEMQIDGGIQSFKFHPRSGDTITTILCRLGERYFQLQDDVRLSHDQIVNLCCRRIVGFND